MEAYVALSQKMRNYISVAQGFVCRCVFRIIGFRKIFLATNPALMAAAAARNAVGNTAVTTSIGEQYLGSALTAALPGYPAMAATYRTLNRFAPY